MKEKIALISILVNVALAGTKIFVGLISHASSILAEGIHSLMDVFSSAIGYLGIRAAKKPADEKHPYGHSKFEVLSGVIITIILFITGIIIAYEAYKKFLNPAEIEFNYLGLAVMVFAAVVNEAAARVKMYFGKKESSLVLISDGFHSRVDVFVSLAVLAGLLLTRYWIFTDPALAFLIGLYVIKESFSLGREAADSLLDVSAGAETEEKIKLIVEKSNIEMETLKTQKKGSTITANLEIKLPSNLKVEEATRISEDLRKKIMKEIENLSYVAIQIKSHEIETGFYKTSFGRSLGWQRRGKFKQELKGAKGKGPGGWCVCPNCGYKAPHQQGTPCSTLRCPYCKISLERK